MESVPKMPCSFELYRYFDGKVHTYGPYNVFFDPLPYSSGETLIVIRCYPKGQNPMSKLRIEKQLQDSFTKQALQTVRNFSNIGFPKDVTVAKGIKLVTEIY